MKEIELLKTIFKDSPDILEPLNKIDKEIERLNKRNKEIYEGFMTTTKELTEYAEEIERLNNIINELENYIRARVDDDNTCSICSVMIDDLLNILEGSDKEWDEALKKWIKD